MSCFLPITQLKKAPEFSRVSSLVLHLANSHLIDIEIHEATALYYWFIINWGLWRSRNQFVLPVPTSHQLHAIGD
jgi:hypothetical protein